MTAITIDRALLEQVLETLDNIPHPPWRDQELADAIRAELAKPSAKDEPVAWVVLADIDGRMVPQYPPRCDRESAEQDALMFKKTKTAVMPLYLHPPPPAWHDAPTEPGLWACVNSDGHRLFQEIASSGLKWVAQDGDRWYGPIPQDIAKEERTK